LNELTPTKHAAWGDRVGIELTDRFPTGTKLWFHSGALLPFLVAIRQRLGTG